MMSKTLRKHDAVKRRVTDYFQRTSSVTIPSSPSRPPSSSSPTSLITPSSPLSFKPSSKPNQPQTRSSKKRSSVSQCMEDPISISSDSPALLSPDPPGTHITISSDADSIIVISDSAPSAVIKHTLSADGLEILSVPRKKRKREQGTPSAKTTVKRSKPVPHLFNSHCSSWRRDGGNPFSRSRHLLNRKIELDSDSEAAIIPSPYSHRSPLRPSPILPEQLQIVPCSLPINRPEGLTLKPSQAQLTLIPSKQPRLRSKASVSSMNSGNDADVEEIPSSQSDEQELIPPKYLKKDLSEVKESVEAWRQRTSEEPAEPLIIEAGPSVINTLFEDVQDVDMLDPPAPPVIGDGVVKQELENQGSQELPQSHTPSQQITPAEHTASTEISSAPLHPLSTQGWTSLTTQPPDPHLDVETVESITLAQEYNTTQIIANIKEKAYAVVLASPSNPKGFIFDPEYLSSDESIKSLQFTAKDRSKSFDISTESPMQQTFPAAEEHSVINATPVYNLRRRDTSTRRCPPSGHSAVRGVRKVSSKTMDPVTKLLRQKQRDEAKGYGHKALLAAEATAYSDESSETDSENEGGIVNLDEAHCEDILGKDGIAVSKILASDKQSDPGDNHVHEEGITLWEDCNETRNTINHIPPIPLSDSEIHASPVLSLLVDVVREKDCVMMSALINIENMGAVPYPQLNLLIPWLCDVAFFSPDSSIALQAFDTLVKIPSIMTPVQDMVFPFTAVITTMYRLGAKFELLQELGWSSSSLPRGQYMVESRLSALFRLVTIVGIFACHCRIADTDLPLMVLSFALIAMDSSITLDLRREIRVVIDTIISNLPTLEQEAQFCDKLMNFAAKLSLRNSTSLLSLLSRSSPKGIRVARWLARSLLLRYDNMETSDIYAPIPPISPICELLAPSPGSKALFDIQGNMGENGYFYRLHSCVQLLDTVLIGIDDYVQLENSKVRLEPEEQECNLNLINAGLDTLHGKIVDTRAAHLDRSRVKAALQQLSFRIYYQRLASKRLHPSIRGLPSYFRPHV